MTDSIDTLAQLAKDIGRHARRAARQVRAPLGDEGAARTGSDRLSGAR